MIVVSSIAWAVIAVLWAGLFVVNPNEARMLQLFGDMCSDRGTQPVVNTGTIYQ